MYAIIHAEGSGKILPFLALTTDKKVHDEYVKNLQDDINEGGGGKLLFHGEIDNVDFHKFWVMTFNK